MTGVTITLAIGCRGPLAPAGRTLADSVYCHRVRELAARGSIEQLDCGIARGPTNEKRIALVFTAGAFCEGGPTFLDTLRDHHAKASFFLTSEAARTTSIESRCAEVVPRLVAEGHYVGLHSDSHPDLVDRQGGRTIIERPAFEEELDRNLAALRPQRGSGDVRYWIPPSETFNEEIATWSAARGLVTVHLTECPATRGDYLPVSAAGGRYESRAIVSRILDCRTKDPHGLNGALLFFHLGVGKNRADHEKVHHAFPALMKALAADGYSFVRIDELLDRTAGRVLAKEVDYARLSPEEALHAKYERMVPFARTRIEREVLEMAYHGLLEGRRRGRWLDVNLEDLMAHARQESGGVLDALDQGIDIGGFHSVGSNVWDFHQLPSGDLSGFISFSVWQTITPNYFWFGPDVSPVLAALHARWVEPHRLTEEEAKASPPACTDYLPSKGEKDAWGFPKKLVRGELERVIDDLTGVLAKDPALHAEVAAALIATHYERSGVRSPAAIRAYFWSAIQKNLDPTHWLEPVRFDDDVAPRPDNGCVDSNAAKRGDYGKQIALGNSYNDRGMVYWYAVTRDWRSIDGLVAAWSSDAGRLTARDYALLRERGLLPWVAETPELYDEIVAHLPAK